MELATGVITDTTDTKEDLVLRPTSRTLSASLAKAMAKTGAASIGSALLGSVATKILATSAGPNAIAIFATLQQTRQVAVIAATANGQTALIQGASSLSGRERREYIRTVAWIFLAATFATSFTLVVSPRWLLTLTAVPIAAVPAIPWLAISVTLLSLFTFLTALLTAAGAIGRLAGSQAAGSAALAAGASPAAQVTRRGYPVILGHLLNFSSAASVSAALWATWRTQDLFADGLRGPGRLWSPRAARFFFSMSGVMLVSGLAASTTLLAVRGRILESEGSIVTGQFDAAWAISMSHVTLVLSAMQSYYLPALSRACLDSTKADQISVVLTVSSLIAALVITGLTVAKPWVLSVLYASSFHSGARFLQWTLLGDYLKVASWIFSIPILAKGDMKTFLVADLSAYATFAGGAALLAPWAGAAHAAAIAFTAMYAVHLAVCAAVVRWGYGTKIRKKAWGSFAAGGVVILLATAFTWDQI